MSIYYGPTNVQSKKKIITFFFNQSNPTNSFASFPNEQPGISPVNKSGVIISLKNPLNLVFGNHFFFFHAWINVTHDEILIEIHYYLILIWQRATKAGNFQTWPAINSNILSTVQCNSQFGWLQCLFWYHQWYY